MTLIIIICSLSAPKGDGKKNLPTNRKDLPHPMNKHERNRKAVEFLDTIRMRHPEFRAMPVSWKIAGEEEEWIWRVRGMEGSEAFNNRPIVYVNLAKLTARVDMLRVIHNMLVEARRFFTASTTAIAVRGFEQSKREKFILFNLTAYRPDVVELGQCVDYLG